VPGGRVPQPSPSANIGDFLVFAPPLNARSCEQDGGRREAHQPDPTTSSTYLLTTIPRSPFFGDANLLCSALLSKPPLHGNGTSLLFLALLCYAFGYAFGYAAACCLLLRSARRSGVFRVSPFSIQPPSPSLSPSPISTQQPTNHKILTSGSPARFGLVFPSPCRALAAPQMIGVDGIMGWLLAGDPL
jgi:hypothetical protein